MCGEAPLGYLPCAWCSFVEVEHWYFSGGALIHPYVRQALFCRSVPGNTPVYNLILSQLHENKETGIWRSCKASHTCEFFDCSPSVKALEWNFYSAAFPFLIFFFLQSSEKFRLHLFFVHPFFFFSSYSVGFSCFAQKDCFRSQKTFQFCQQ